MPRGTMILSPWIEAAARAGLAAVVQPQDAEGEDAVDGGLRLLFVDGDDGPGFWPWTSEPRA